MVICSGLTHQPMALPESRAARHSPTMPRHAAYPYHAASLAFLSLWRSLGTMEAASFWVIAPNSRTGPGPVPAAVHAVQPQGTARVTASGTAGKCAGSMISGWNKNARFGVILSVIDLAPNAARLMTGASSALVTSPTPDLSSNGEAGHVGSRSRPWDVYWRVLRAAHRGSLCGGSARCRRVGRSEEQQRNASCAAIARERPQLI